MPRTLSPNAGLRVLSPDEFVYNADDPTYSGAGEFSKAVTSAGIAEDANRLATEAAKAMVAGDVELGRRLDAQAKELYQRAAAWAPRVQQASDIRGAGDFVDWAAGATGSGLRSSLRPALGGLAGGVLGALSPIPGGAAIGASLGSGITGYNVGTDENVGNAMMDPELRAKGDYAGMLREGRKTGALQGVTEGLFGAAGGLGSAVMGTERRILAKALAEATAAKGGAALTKREVADISTRLLRERVAEDGAAKFMAKHTLPEMGGEGFTEGVQNIQGQQMMQNLKGTDEGYDWSSALNDATAGALPGGATALPGGAALVARSKLGQGAEAVRRDPVGVIADGISGASSLAGTGAARLSDWAARATSEPLRAHDALVNDGTLSDEDVRTRAVQWAEHVLNNAREFSADERTDAQRFIQNMNDPAALTAYRDKLTFDHHGAIGDAASDDLVSELGGQTGQSKASRMEASPVAPEDVISGGADITAAYERARAQQSRDDVAEILRKQGVAEKLLGSLAGASEDKQRAALSSVLGWMQSGFKGSGDKVFMPRTLINAFGKGTESLLNRMADTALLHGVIKPEVRDQLPAVIDIARKLHAEETSVDDAVFGNMIGDAAKAFRPIRKEFIPEMRRMAQNGTTKAEEDFLLRLYGSKERIAAAMSKFAEDRKDIRLETQGVATEDEEGNVEGDYEGGTEVVPGQTKVSYIGHGANKDRPYNTLYADKKAELATLLSTLHNEHGLFHHQIGAWKALKEQWGSNPEVLRQKEDEALLDSERKRSWTSDDDANYLSTLDGMDEERRLSLLKAYDESHKLVKVTETVSESTPDTITPEQVESFREKSLRVKDAAGNWVDNNTPENRRLFLERETSVNEDTGEVTGKNEAFLTSTLRLMKHVWRSQEEGQTNAGKRKGALAEYDAFMRGLAALIQSDGSFTGRIGFQTEPGGDVRWMRIDAVRKKGNVSAMKLPRNLRLSKSTVNDALAQQKTEALAGGKMNAELTDVSSEPGDQIFSDTDKDIVPSESTSDEARSFTSLREGPTGEIYRDAHGVAQGLGGDAEGLSVVGTGGAGTRPVARREKGEKIAALTQAELDRNEQRKKEGLEPVYPAVRRGNFASRKSEHATDSAGSPRATKRTERAVEPVSPSQLSALDTIETARDWVVKMLRDGTPTLLGKIEELTEDQLNVVDTAIFGKTDSETFETRRTKLGTRGQEVEPTGSTHTTTSHAAGLVDLVGDQLGKLYFNDAPERGRMLASRLKAGAERIAQAIDTQRAKLKNGQAKVQSRAAQNDEGSRRAPAQGNTDAGGREAGVAARDQGRRNAGQSPVVASGQGRESEVKTWARAAENGYEVSTAGDKRFSALNARLKDGRTIEEAYQLDVKGFRKYSNDWRIGKGKKPLDRSIDRYAEYKKLWQQWAAENPGYISELRKRSEGKVLTDKFASTDVSQARALAEILNEQGETSGQGRKSEVTSESLRDTAKARFAEAKTPRDKINFLFDELKGLLDQTDMTSSFGHTFTYNKKTQPELELAQYLEYLSDAVRNLGDSMTPKQRTALNEMSIKAYRAFKVWAGDKSVVDVIEAGEAPAAKQSKMSAEAPNTQPAGVRTRQATQEEVDAAVEHITKTLGDSVALDFKKFFGDNTSGRWTPRKVKNLIEIALNSDVLGTAYHESMHEFFAMLGEHGGEAVQALLTRVATNKIVLNQLYKRLADHKGAIEQLSDKEEALTFMYQFSLADPSFKLGPETKTLFQKIRQFFAKVFNRVSAETKDAEMADRILAGFTRGEFKDTGTREALIKALNANVEAHNKALESRGKVVQTLIDTFGKAVFSNEAMMELTKNPFMVAIIRKANQKAGEAMGEKAAYFDALHSATGQWMNRLENILRQAGGDKEVLEIARKALATGKPTHHPVASNIVKEIRAFNDAMHAYMTTRGVMRYDPEAENAKWGTKGDWVKVPFRKDYFPQAWDVDALMKNADAFKKLLLTHNMKALEAIAANANAELARVDSAKDAGTRRAAEKALGPAAKEMHDSGARQTVTPELVADALYARLLNANGHGDLQESTSNVGMSPAASAVNRRELDFIEHPDFDAFKEKDLVKIMTGYTRGMVKRAEYTHVFGPGGEGLSELADKAMLHELGGEKLIKAAEDGMAPAVEQWKKEKAAAIAAGEEFTKPFPTLRSVGQAQHFATVGREQGVADLKAATGKLANGYQAIMALEGTLGADITPQGRLLNSMLITYQSLRTLSTALFGSMNDVMGIVVNGGELGDAWDAFTKGVREIGLSWKGQKSADDAARRAELFGTIEATVALDALGETYGSMWQSGRMKKVSDNFFKWNGMEGWNRAMRITATAVAERQILDYKQNGYDKNDPAAVARFERLFGKGFDPANIAVDADGRVDVSDAKNQAAVMRWVSDAVMLPNASHRPIPASDPHFATFYHLKQFSYTMHRVMLKNAMEQAKLGNYRPAMVLVTGYAPVMIAADAAKELMIPGDEPPWMKNGIGAYLRHGIERAGLGGVPQMYLSNVIDFDPAALFGPTVDQVQNMASIPFMEKHTVTKEGLGALPGGNVLRRAG